ncbi:MAG: hypothetical protein QXK12_06630, partial [Candidatus Nezhaarchaeales archaeon]
IEYYADMVYLDAEWIAYDAARMFYTDYLYGPGPWHTISIGWLGEADKKLAFSADKAEKLKVEWMNFIAGPSLPILKDYLTKAISEKFIPYPKALGKYLSEAEALERYGNLKAWYEAKGHFLVGNGPFYVDKVDPTARILVLKAYREFVDAADKWVGFVKPKVPEVKIVSAPAITPGLPAEVTVSITFEGKPYGTGDISYVKYTLISPTVTLTGNAEAVKDGEWRIKLTPSQTSMLAAGPLDIEVLTVSKLVAIPVFAKGATTVMSVTEYLMSEIGKVKADYEAKISGLKTTIDSLSSKVDSLSGALSSLTATSQVAIGVAVVAIILSIALPIALRRKK